MFSQKAISSNDYSFNFSRPTQQSAHFMHSLHMLTSLPTGSVVPQRAHSFLACSCAKQPTIAQNTI